LYETTFRRDNLKNSAVLDLHHDQVPAASSRLLQQLWRLHHDDVLSLRHSRQGGKQSGREFLLQLYLLLRPHRRLDPPRLSAREDARKARDLWRRLSGHSCDAPVYRVRAVPTGGRGVTPEGRNGYGNGTGVTAIRYRLRYRRIMSVDIYLGLSLYLDLKCSVLSGY